MPKKDKKNKKIFQCSCGYKQKEIENAVMTEKLEEKETVDVVDKEINPNPVVDAECPKCKHTKASYWTVQTRASDEPETKFYKCEKCGHVWRDYS